MHAFVVHGFQVCLILLIAGLSGCQSPQLASLQSQNRTLSEQSTAQLAEIANLKAHARRVENQLITAEQQIASIEQSIDTDRQQIAHIVQQKELLDRKISPAVAAMPSGVTGQLARLSQRHPSLQYDPETGISKLDTDILFDQSQVGLKPDAQAMLVEFAQILQSPEARNAKIMIAGHTDASAAETSQASPDPWYVSTNRAVVVAQQLKQAGISEDRIAVSGFGAHQPLVANETAADRRRNRRVEIFVVEPTVPIVGWNETMPRFY